MLHDNRMDEFLEVLGAERIDLERLRSLCRHGIPDDDPSIRPLCWKILLGYLPLQRRQWATILQERREAYYQFIVDIASELKASGSEISKPSNGTNTSATSMQQSDEIQWDHINDPAKPVESPILSRSKTDANPRLPLRSLLDQIDKDVRRTMPEHNFFQAETSTSNEHMKQIGPEPFATIRAAAPLGDAVFGCRYSTASDCRWMAMERILLVLARLNSSVGYVQGMSDICSVLYYAIASDPSPEFYHYSEADCFYCLSYIMGEFRDNFIRSMDTDSEAGISATLGRMAMILKRKDTELSENMSEKGLELVHFSFRWITVLLAQDFNLPDVIRTWDSLFAEKEKSEFLAFICSTMIIQVRKKLIAGSFADNISLLQNYIVNDVDLLLNDAQDLREEFARGYVTPIAAAVSATSQTHEKKIGGFFSSLFEGGKGISETLHGLSFRSHGHSKSSHSAGSTSNGTSFAANASQTHPDSQSQTQPHSSTNSNSNNHTNDSASAHSRSFSDASSFVLKGLGSRRTSTSTATSEGHGDGAEKEHSSTRASSGSIHDSLRGYSKYFQRSSSRKGSTTLSSTSDSPKISPTNFWNANFGKDKSDSALSTPDIEIPAPISQPILHPEHEQLSQIHPASSFLDTSNAGISVGDSHHHDGQTESDMVEVTLE